MVPPVLRTHADGAVHVESAEMHSQREPKDKRRRWRAGVLKRQSFSSRSLTASSQSESLQLVRQKKVKEQKAASLAVASKETQRPIGSRQKSTCKRRWDPTRHFKHQVAIIRQLIRQPRKWKLFLGNLGTGIVGVRSRAQRKRSGGSDLHEGIRMPNLPLKSGSSSLPDEDRCDENGYVILFMNTTAARLQFSHGKTLSGFDSFFDPIAKTLKWESQRNDRHGRVIARIAQHAARGGQVVVAARDTPGKPFQILGLTTSFVRDGTGKAQFLLRNGEHVIAEVGCRRVHKSIRAQCLEDGLKSGIGLVPHKFPLPKAFGTPTYCTACCWTPPSATLTFACVDEVAAKLFLTAEKRNSLCEDEVSIVSDERVTRKRLRGKQPVVKLEVEDIACQLASETGLALPVVSPTQASAESDAQSEAGTLPYSDELSDDNPESQELTCSAPARLENEAEGDDIQVLASEREKLLERLADINNQLICWNASSAIDQAKGGLIEERTHAPMGENTQDRATGLLVVGASIISSCEHFFNLHQLCG